MLKKGYLFLILFVCFFTISAISAEEIGNNSDLTVNNQDSLISESVDDTSLNAAFDTFQELPDEINDVDDGGTLNLTKNYGNVNDLTDDVAICGLNSDFKDFIISKAGSSVTICDVGDRVYGSDVVVSFDVVNATRVSYVLLKDGEMFDGELNPVYDIDFGVLGAGFYCFSVFNEGTDNFESSSDSVNFTISKAGSSVTICDVSDRVYGSDVVVSFDVVNATRVSYVLLKDGEVFDGELNPVYDIDFGVLGAGFYCFSVFNEGTDNFESSSDSVNFTISKAGSSVNIDDVGDRVYGSDVVVSFDVVNETTVTYIFKKDGEVIEQGPYLFSFIDFGVLDAGSYCFSVFNVGTDDYESSSDSKNFTISKADSFVNIYDIEDVVYGSDVVVSFDVVNETTVTYILRKDGEVIEQGPYLFSFIDFGVLDAGSYTINISNAGTDNYKSSSDAKSFNVNKSNSKITIDVYDFDVDSSDIAIISFDGDVTGDVIICIDGNVVGNESIFNSRVIYMLKGLNAGQHTIEAVYNGDKNYLANSTSAKFNVIPLDSYIYIFNTVLIQGENLIIDVPYDATGLINLSINGNTYNLSINDSQAIFNTSILSEGEYPIEVYYSGDNRYSDYELTSDIEIHARYKIDAPDVTNYYHGGKRFVITLTDGFGEPMVGESVNIVINGATYARTTDYEGQASIALGLNVGVYDVIVRYNDISVNSTVTVLSTIYASDITKMYKNDTQFYATLMDSEGGYLYKGTPVTLNLNGIFYSQEIIDNKGTVKLDINDEPGEYILTTQNPVTDQISTNIITILSIIVENYDLAKYYNETDNFSVRIIGSDGNPALGGKVRFNIGNNSYERISDSMGYAYLDEVLQPGEYEVNTSYGGYEVTNIVKIFATLSDNDMKVSSSDILEGENEIINVSLPNDATGIISTLINNEIYSANINGGIGSISIPDLKHGEYSVEVIYSGDSRYNAVKNNTIFNVEPSIVISAPNVTKYYGGSERFVVGLKNRAGNPIINVPVSININGVDYTRYTNADGEASMALGLPSKVYEVTTTYDGIAVKSTVTIKDTVYADDFTKMYKNGTQYYGTFVDSTGKTLAENTLIEININGVFYIRYTNDKGVARMNINLNPGTYVLTATNPSTGEMHTTTITVLPTIVENHDLTKYYKNASQYSLRLLDDKGNHVGAGVNVKLNINGVFYTRTSDAMGYVKMNINLNPGEYVITAEYNGLMASNRINVLPILEGNDMVMTYKDGSKFEAKLLDGQGNPFAGQTVTFNINGVFYNRITDNEGIARLSINLMPGTYVITSMYANGAAISNNIVINEDPNWGYEFINLPSYDTTTTVQSGIYKIEVHQWRSPGLGEVNIFVYDSNGNMLREYNYDSKIFDGTRWSGSYSTFEYATYHKWQFTPDVRITQVAVKIY